MWPLALAIVDFVFALILMVGGGHGANAFVLAWAQKTVLRATSSVLPPWL